MAASLTLAVPEMVTALYLVPSMSEVADPEALLRADTGAGADDGSLVEGFLERNLLSVTTRTALPGELPLDVLRVFGADDADLATVESCPHLVVVEAAFGPGWPPMHEVVARTAAAALARATDGLVIDAATPRLLTADELVAPLPDGHHGLVLTGFVLVPQSSEEDGRHWMVTKGLARFGLPEIRVLDVPAPLAPAWTAVLSGLAWSLLFRFDAALRAGRIDGVDELPSPVELSDVVEVDTGDIAAAHGNDPEGDEGRAAIQVELASLGGGDGHEHLTVRPPDGVSPQEHYAWVVDAVFGAPSG
ncbi:hypothetical protein BH23ACT2_BH23ACT2_00590 [soil metagenome]